MEKLEFSFEHWVSCFIINSICRLLLRRDECCSRALCAQTRALCFNGRTIHLVWIPLIRLLDVTTVPTATLLAGS